MTNRTFTTTLSRRRFLQTCGISAATVFIPGAATAAVNAAHKQRKLAFDNLHTGEKLALTYFERGRYLPDALKEIDHLLRDHRTGDIVNMDPKLIDLLFDLISRLNTNQPIQIISGYRSPATNASLHKKSSGVAKHSLHMLGKAIDIRMPNIDSETLKKTAIALQKGGVGYYPKSDFVHIDTGRVRYW